MLLTLYFAAFGILAFFSMHRLWLLLLMRRHGRPLLGHDLPSLLPRVTVQLPIYNERFVVERLLCAVECLDYPRELLDVQVLDDSTDATRDIISQRVAEMQARAFPVVVLRRATRVGFKAGALANGLLHARGALILILDADFVPQPSLIKDLLPGFNDAKVGMVQARWGHLNREASALTRAQALLLDAHFLLETAARADAGLFFNFHGTAGMWRRAAIESAGGWSADTVTEDLDISYRAQLAGWKFVFRPDVIVQAELPSTLAAFRQQQARWAHGTVGTARKHLLRILHAQLPLGVKAEATFHLTCHIIYPATLVVALLALPVALLGALPMLQLALALSVIVPTRIFYRRAARAAGTRPPGMRQMPQLMLTGIALSASNTTAVVAGLFGMAGDFHRTPKQGSSGATYAVPTSSWLRSFNGGLAAYLAFATTLAVFHGLLGAVVPFAWLAYAFGTAAMEG